MKHSDIALLMKGIAPTLREFVTASAQPLAERIVALERQIASQPVPEKGDPGEVDMEAVARLIDAAVAEVGSHIEPRAVDMDEVRQIVADEVAKMPPVVPVTPEPYEPDPEQIRQMVSEIAQPVLDDAIAAIPEPQDGKSVTVEDLAPMVEELVSTAMDTAVRGLPVPEDGEDGVGVAGALIDRDGNLVLTLSNGEIKELGQVVGRDADDIAIERRIKEMVDAIPRPKDGLDGLGFDDLEVIHDGARSFTFRFANGDKVKEFAFTLPVMLDRGVYHDGRKYQPGDGVTWGGSYWICQKETGAKPDQSDDWRLAVKKGQNGKDGVLKEKAAPQPVKVS